MTELNLMDTVARTIAKHTAHFQGTNSLELNAQYRTSVDLIRPEHPIFSSQLDSLEPNSWMRWLTQDRLAYAQVIGALLQDLSQIHHGIDVLPEKSWQWSSVKSQKDLTRNEKLFGLMIFFRSNTPSNIVDVQRILPTICQKSDLRSEMCLFQFQEQELRRLVFRQYQWNPQGFTCWVQTKDDIQDVRGLFFDCVVEQLTPNKVDNIYWPLQVIFPT